MVSDGSTRLECAGAVRAREFQLHWVVMLVVAVGCSAPPCGPATCSGCCAEDGVCVDGQTRAECGARGDACQRCTTEETCTRQQCTPTVVFDGGLDAGPPVCRCTTSCCYPDGTCAPNNGPEACGPAGAFCGQCAMGERCERGTCLSMSCGGCFDPLGTCHSGTASAQCGTNGGVCVACGADQACSGGRCVFTRCDLGNCRFGCCRPDKSCDTAPSAASCGTGGEPCVACAAMQVCISGACF